MTNEPDKRPLLTFAHDGKALHAEIRVRLQEIGGSMNRLCKEAAVSFSTTDRWKDGSEPRVNTVRRIEWALEHWGRRVIEHNQSNIPIPSPNACI